MISGDDSYKAKLYSSIANHFVSDTSSSRYDNSSYYPIIYYSFWLSRKMSDEAPAVEAPPAEEAPAPEEAPAEVAAPEPPKKAEPVSL